MSTGRGVMLLTCLECMTPKAASYGVQTLSLGIRARSFNLFLCGSASCKTLIACHLQTNPCRQRHNPVLPLKPFFSQVQYLPADRPATANLIWAHGYGEHVGRYEKVFSKIAQAGIAVHSFDAEGHG
eukprot:360592-Pelagomonas_calceolata.AAC.4